MALLLKKLLNLSNSVTVTYYIKRLEDAIM
jgi:hypothetical protein